jgi:hypothetical protein
LELDPENVSVKYNSEYILGKAKAEKEKAMRAAEAEDPTEKSSQMRGEL